jgi:dolichol-phosphate mannosyltransferase
MHNFLIIVPCLNEEKNIEKFIIKSKSLFDEKYNFKILFVDDGSSDYTWELIKKFRKKFSFIRGIKLSRNFGKENAISCGLNNFNDVEFVVTIDADLQHPLEKIEEMINLWTKGYKIINTYRLNSDRHIFRNFLSWLFYAFIKKFTNIKISNNSTDFILLDNEIVKKYNELKENDKQYRSLVNWLGYKKILLPIKINFRTEDKSKYRFGSLLRLAANIIVSYSLFPFRLLSYLGLMMFLIILFLLIIIIINKLFFLNSLLVSTNSIILLVQICLTGLILISISLLGVYLNKILQNTFVRPSYLIEEKTD